MTTIAVAWDRDTICVAADSLTTSGDTVYPARLGKIISNRSIVLAGAGEHAMLQLLSSNMSWVPKNNKDFARLGETIKHIITRADLVEVNNGVVSFDALAIVVYKNIVYQLERDFMMHRLSGPSHAIGSGARFARGAMYGASLSAKRNLWKPPTIRDTARLGVEAGCAYDVYSAKPLKSVTIKRRQRRG